MSDRIITRAISPYVSWQGPEAACQTFSDEDVQRNKFKHEGIAVNTRHYAPCRTQSVGYDLVHSYEGTTENAKHVNLNLSLPEISFKTSTHAYECGYRDGLKAAQAEAPAVDPVAWMIEGYGPTENQKFAEKYSQARGKLVTPLYATPAAPAVKVATHRHVKRGTEYRLIGTGNVQTDTPLGDYTEVAIYQGAEGDLWVRPVGEFEDGRFELIGSALEGGAA